MEKNKKTKEKKKKVVLSDKKDTKVIGKRKVTNEIKVASNTKKSTKKDIKKPKKNLLDKFMLFFHGVGSETKKVVWPTKEEMIKYSLATIIFVIFCSLFFYAIDILFALVQSLFS